MIDSLPPSHSPFGKPSPCPLCILAEAGEAGVASMMAVGGVPRVAEYGEGMKEGARSAESARAQEPGRSPGTYASRTPVWSATGRPSREEWAAFRFTLSQPFPTYSPGRWRSCRCRDPGRGWSPTTGRVTRKGEGRVNGVGDRPESRRSFPARPLPRPSATSLGALSRMVERVLPGAFRPRSESHR